MLKFKELSLKELCIKKSHDYYDAARDSIGRPTKSLMNCYLEACEDFGVEELDSYNASMQKRINFINSRDKQVVWADESYDNKRICNMCFDSTCFYPVHREDYNHFKPKDVFHNVEDNEDLCLLNESNPEMALLVEVLEEYTPEERGFDDPEVVCNDEDAPSYEVPR